MEFVFVVPRSVLFPDFYPHGLVPFQDHPGDEHSCLSRAAFDATVAREGFFVERSYAERTPALKQIIPYTIVMCDERVLLLRRLKTGGEARLFDKHSIGVGGHIDPPDMDEATRAGEVRNPIDAGSRREIAEELEVRGSYKLRRIGVLNDDSNSVGAVHVGVVQLATVSGSVEIRERDQLEGRLVTPAELRTLHDQGANFETWSKLLVARFDELLPQPLAVTS